MNVYEVAIRVLPLFPDAQIAEDEDGQVVIMTGVKKMDPPPPGTSLFAASKWYRQPCISLKDYCVERGLNIELVLEVLHESDISFGLNDDTLVREERLCRLLGIEPPEYERYMISLGC